MSSEIGDWGLGVHRSESVSIRETPLCLFWRSAASL